MGMSIGKNTTFPIPVRMQVHKASSDRGQKGQVYRDVPRFYRSKIQSISLIQAKKSMGIFFSECEACRDIPMHLPKSSTDH